VNLATNLTETLARAGADRPALRTAAAVVTYGALEDASARVADLLRDRGFEPGDRVGLMLPNVPEFAFIYYGILRAGATAVPMGGRFGRRPVGGPSGLQDRFDHGVSFAGAPWRLMATARARAARTASLSVATS
jgi:acyl-CoA synthetase (AMP-forming)/AMP-acid ligase II